MSANPPTTAEILAERGKRYGEFREHATLSQQLKDVMAGWPGGWAHLKPDQREALEMVAHKIARILNGDPDYADSWDDIAGYAKLVADRLHKEPRPVGDGLYVYAPTKGE